MTRPSSDAPALTVPKPAAIKPSALLELLKPVTWFPPMWAYMCGVVSSGMLSADKLLILFTGILLAGPLVCGTSQVANDWYDRHVDAINEPGRPIPSGRVPGRIGLYFAIVWTAVSLIVAWTLGIWGFLAAVLGLVLAWAYSAPPVRLKSNGWYGNLAVGLCYEGLPWFTGAAIMAAAFPDWRVIALAVLYSLGAHGIMTLNDFKAIEGDIKVGIRTLPVQLGPERAAKLACVVMLVPQVVVIGLLIAWQLPLYAAAVSVSALAQAALMKRLLRDPRAHAPWYNGTGIILYVLGMLVSAFGVSTLSGGIA